MKHSTDFRIDRRLGQRVRFVAMAVFAIAAMSVVTGCGDDVESTPQATPPAATPAQSTGGQTVAVDLNEFTIKPSPTSATAGDVTFVATNTGKLPHEMIVMKTDLEPSDLPSEQNGNHIEEEGPGMEFIGEIHETEPGKTATEKMNLTAGKYILFCNVPTHFKNGQYIKFDVK